MDLRGSVDYFYGFESVLGVEEEVDVVEVGDDLARVWGPEEAGFFEVSAGAVLGY